MPNEPYTHMQYGVGYFLVDPENASVVPHKIDDGLYRLHSPISFSIGYNQIKKIKMGLILDIPDPFVMRIENNQMNVVLHVNVSSAFDVLEKKGILVLGPAIISPQYQQVELELLITTCHHGSVTVKKGDELAELSFSLSPATFLGIKNL